MVCHKKPCRSGKTNQRAARCGSSDGRKTPQCSAANAADGFLKARFLPVRANRYPQLENRYLVEKQFFASLHNLAALYGFKPLAKNNHIYPYNIACAFDHAQAHVSKHCERTSLAIIRNENSHAVLVTYKEHLIGQTLYYLPVRRLWELMQDESRSAQADLLLSVFCYLHQIAGLPMFTEPDSYLWYQYEMVYDFYSTDEDMEPGVFSEFEEQFSLMKKAGKSLSQSLICKQHLLSFENRLKGFTASCENETMLKQVAGQFLELYQHYRERNIFDSTLHGFEQPREEQRITPAHYISLIWDLDSSIAHDLISAVNAELQECTVMDLPATIQLFDEPQSKVEMCLDFEQRFFGLLDDLSDLLNML